METGMMRDKLQINSAAITDRGLSEKRPQNEDSYLELRDSGFFAVADGVGGAQAGDVASQMAMEILGEAFINLPVGGDAEERMKLAIEQANHAIFQMSRDLQQLSTMATTVVGLHINDNIATIGHVGDSRLYRIDSAGNLFRETHDHSVVEEEVRAGRMTPEQAETHPSRNVISRALGAENLVEIDMKTIMFDPGTTFLLCSDGVTRHISDDELQDLLFSENDTFAICRYIKDICYRRGAEDNLTAVVVKVVPAGAESEPRSEELEEETIASVRPAAASGDPDTAAEAESQFSEDTLEMPEVEPLQEADGDTDDGPEIDEESPKSVSILDGDELSRLGLDTQPEPVSRDEVIAFSAEGYEESFGARLLVALPWILLTASLAVLAYYIFYPSVPAPEAAPPVLQSKSSDIDENTFEQSLRTLDTNPERYIAAYSVDPKDAEDFYLLGRAYFLQKDYESAKTSLDRAKTLLPTHPSPGNKKVLETEIPLLLTVINTAAAKTAFDKEASAVSQSDEGADGNSNTR